MTDKIVIGLTGNIATGKSIVLRMFQELGTTTIDADKMVHRLMVKGTPVYQAIVEEFGKYVLDQTGQISRPKLGKIVFSDPDGLVKLENITHPAVRQEIMAGIANAPTQVVVIEAIKLFEADLADHCQSTWVVVAPAETQLKRLVERRKMSPGQAKQRIKAQSSQQEKAAKADVVIDNSAALAKTWASVKQHYLALVQPQAEAKFVPVEPEPTPEPAASKVAAPTSVDTSNITIRRAKRGDLGAMAELITAGTKGAVSLDVNDMMESLFSRAYIVALAGDHVVGMAGWQTENLIAGLQDFYVLRDDLWVSTGLKMLDVVHEEINNLSCEVALCFVLKQAGSVPIEFLESQDYQQSSGRSLIPDWQDAVSEWQPHDSILLYKKTREQRIMVPM